MQPSSSKRGFTSINADTPKMTELLCDLYMANFQFSKQTRW